MSATPPRHPADTAEPEGSSAAQLRALLQRWQDSLNLHARYLDLDDERYRHVQPWPRHERPAKWIVELARGKVQVLARIVEQRGREGDRAFLEALELMGFMSTLVGLSNVERFIPLCDSASERREVLNAQPPTRQQPQRPPAAPAAMPAAPTAPPPADDHTREMPQLPAGRIGRMLLAQQAGVPYKIAPEAQRMSSRKRLPESASAAAARAPGRAPTARSATQPATSATAARPGTKPIAPQPPPLAATDAVVVEDAVRLLGWGREWHELAEIIARLADRPAPTHIRRILREQRPLIERRQRQ